jgi:hypothetical protein
MSPFGPSRQIVRCSDTSEVGGYADIARTVEVRLQPRHAFLIGGGRRNSSGSLAMFGGDAPGLVAGQWLGRAAWLSRETIVLASALTRQLLRFGYGPNRIAATI